MIQIYKILETYRF